MVEKVPAVEFRDVSKIYPKMKNAAVKNISFKIEKGDFCCLIGTSGSGKTTLMRMINRMNSVTKGEVLVGGKNVKSFNPVNLRRHIGYVIQNNGLMPHMTIRDNIILVPKLLKWPKDKLSGEAQKLIKMAELPESYLDRYPSELSGGQQQRIGVVRALAANQNLILMDEPFGALDPITRESLQNLIQNLQVRLGKTIVFVTHDMDEIGEERLSEAKYETVKVKNVMLTNPTKIDLGASLTDALTMMKEHRVDTLLVVDNGDHLKGYISIDDLQRNYPKASSVSDILITKLGTVGPEEYLRDNFSRIMSRNKSYIPVTDSDKKLVGIVTRASLVNVVYEKIWGDKSHLQSSSEKEAK